MTLKAALAQRILILDGAMGTQIQQYNLTEEDYRGKRFADSTILQRGNNDLLCLTQPQIISEIHKAYLKAGADIIETCTFNSQRISMEEYGMSSMVRELNLSGAQIARSAADQATKENPAKPRFVVGSVGPTSKTCSMSPDVNNPAYRAISFDQLTEAYIEQMTALVEGGVDALLIETIFDTLNAKAAIYAAQKVISESKKAVEIMLSATVADISGRTLSGQTISAFMASVSHANMLSIGLNCSFGAHQLKPYLEIISKNAPCYVSAYPNAGLPNQFGQYDETPETMAEQVKHYIDEGLVNIIGGCCGTSPAHIAKYEELVAGVQPRKPQKPTDKMQLAGLEMIEL